MGGTNETKLWEASEAAEEREVAMGRAPQRHGMPVRSAGVGARGDQRSSPGTEQVLLYRPVRHQRRDGAEKVSTGAPKQVSLLCFFVFLALTG